MTKINRQAPVAGTHALDGAEFPSGGGVAAGTADGVVVSPCKEMMRRDGTADRSTDNFMALPYNPDLKRVARKLRKAGNLAEVLLWDKIKNGKFKTYDFDRQKIIGNYIVDFFCANCNVVIEIDGGSHEYKQQQDIERDEFLRSLGLEVIRVHDRDVRKNISGVLDMLYDHPALDHPVRYASTPPPEGNRYAPR